MDIRPHTEDDYRTALAEVSALVDRDPEPGTPEGGRLEISSVLVEGHSGTLTNEEQLAFRAEWRAKKPRR